MHLIGLDIGTTGCKAIVFDEQGTVLGQGFHEYAVLCKEPGMAEQDPEEVWRLARGVLRQAIAESGVQEVAALSLSAQGDAIIPLDARLNPIYPAILGMDYRSQPQALRCEQQLGGFELFQKTGMRPHPMNSIIKAMWLRENRPEVFARATRIVTYADFILNKLGGELLIDYTMASRTMGFDLHSRAWSPEILGRLDLPPGLFSKAVPSGTPAGNLDKALTTELGLRNLPLLVTGAHDQPCAAIGSGAVREGIGVMSTGTAEVFSTSLARPALSRQMYESYYPCYLHGKDGLYFTFALNHVGGILLRWYRDNFAQAELADAAKTGLDPYQIMDARMSDQPSPLMVVPHWNGSGTPSCDMAAKGAVLGWTMSSTRHDLSKAILEGLSFELKINLDRLTECGAPIDQVIAAGGGAKSSIWLQLKADILNRPIETLRCREAACLGAALLAGTAAGCYASLDEAVNATVKYARAFEPRPPYVKRYQERFEVYRGIYPALKDLNERL